MIRCPSTVDNKLELKEWSVNVISEQIIKTR